MPKYLRHVRGEKKKGKGERKRKNEKTSNNTTDERKI